MATMDGEFPEQFKCPVCLEVPEKEIYQCQNGHTICNFCYLKLISCPQCRVSLGSIQIRNRQLEELLDMMKFDCSYKQAGCNAKVGRKEVKYHFENCLFGGTQVSLCMALGYSCLHKVNSKRLKESLTHLQAAHRCLLSNKNVLDIKLKRIRNVDETRRCLWQPIVVNAFNNHYLVVICSVKSHVSFGCLSLGKIPNDNVQIQFLIVSPTNKGPVLEWTTKPFQQDNCELVLESPPFQFPLNLLVNNYIVQDDLTISFHMTDSNFNNVNQRKETLSLDSFIAMQPNPTNHYPTFSLCNGIQPNLPLSFPFERIQPNLTSRNSPFSSNQAQPNLTNHNLDLSIPFERAQPNLTTRNSPSSFAFLQAQTNLTNHNLDLSIPFERAQPNLTSHNSPFSFASNQGQPNLTNHNSPFSFASNQAQPNLTNHNSPFPFRM